jgi:hypothetical protein
MGELTCVKGRCAGDHEERAEAGEFGDDVLGDTVTEILLPSMRRSGARFLLAEFGR